MSRKLFLIRNILFLILIIGILIIFNDLYNDSTISLFNITLTPNLVLLMFVLLSLLNIFQIIKKIDYINYNHIYNGAFIMSCIIMLVIILNVMFARQLVVKIVWEKYTSLQFNSDINYLILILLGLIIYNIGLFITYYFKMKKQ